jgi:hypothetical protein
MSYDEGLEFGTDAPYDTAESDAEQAAHHQRNLDVMYFLANQYDMRIDHAKLLCDLSGISFEEFCKYTGGTK